MERALVTFREVKVGDVVIEKEGCWLVTKVIEVLHSPTKPTVTLFEGEGLTHEQAREIKINQIIWKQEFATNV